MVIGLGFWQEKKRLLRWFTVLLPVSVRFVWNHPISFPVRSGVRRSRTDYNRFKCDVLLLEEDVRSVRYELGVPGLTNGV